MRVNVLQSHFVEYPEKNKNKIIILMQNVSPLKAPSSECFTRQTRLRMRLGLGFFWGTKNVFGSVSNNSFPITFIETNIFNFPINNFWWIFSIDHKCVNFPSFTFPPLCSNSLPKIYIVCNMCFQIPKYCEDVIMGRPSTLNFGGPSPSPT